MYRRTRHACTALLLALVVVAGGGDDEAGDPAPSTTFPSDFSAETCLIELHGRSETGAAPREEDGWAVLRPDGNEPWDAGWVWIYDSDESLAAARGQVTEVADAAGCTTIALHGFSNGAAFAAALACTGETLDGRLVGVVVDDPVPDDASPACAVDSGVEVALYWTGGLEVLAGDSCDDLGWTCAGSDELVGIDEYARRLGTEVQPSIHEDHTVHDAPPEIEAWLGGAG